MNFTTISSSTAEEKVGVLLLNLGGPETLNDVQPFLYNLFADPVSYSAKRQLCYVVEVINRYCHLIHVLVCLVV